MQTERRDGANGARVAEVDRLRATCGRQRLALDKLREAVEVLRSGGCALKEENAELRAENARLRDERGAGSAVESRLTADVRAPAAARRLVAGRLGTHVAADVLANAQLVVSELVANSVRHGAASPEDGVTVRVALERTSCRLEVEDAGSGGEVVPRPPDRTNGGGLGLHIVQQLSERWGMERATGGGTRVWAHLSHVPR